MAPIIRTEKLRKVYAVGKERVVALNNVDLSIEKGEFCCIVGQSGSGKSTLLNQLAGLEKPTSGKVYIGKHEISKMTENELAEFRQQHLGFIFQSYNLLPTMTAAENVALPLMFKGVDKKTRLARARKELKSMGLLGHVRYGHSRAGVGRVRGPHCDDPGRQGLLQRRAGRGDEEEKSRRPLCRSGRESGYWRGGSEGTEKVISLPPWGKVPEAPTEGG